MKQYASLIFSMPVEVTCETKRGGGGRAAMLIGPGLNSEPYTMPTTSQLRMYFDIQYCKMLTKAWITAVVRICPTCSASAGFDPSLFKIQTITLTAWLSPAVSGLHPQRIFFTMLRHSVVILVLLVSCISPSAASGYELRLLSSETVKATGAYCLDGRSACNRYSQLTVYSAPGYYLRRGTEATKFKIHMQGSPDE